ncbi:hypothetical protein [Mesorhizobium sp. KR9-304]|uniref:hypothetical protein n=1 Tax=Mesorhizobium sp. KR9-304 TaxID=3156614 RepID=UPI0032B49136
MPKVSVRLSRNAAEKARKPDDLREAALAAFQAAGAGDIYFALFKSNGQQFALSSRTIVEVDWVPNRLPDKVIRQGGRSSAKKR